MVDKARFEMINEKKMKYCMKHGHDWAIKVDADNNAPEWMHRVCTICGAQQLFYVEMCEPAFDKVWNELHD